MSDLLFGPFGESLLHLIQGVSNVFLDIYFGVLTTLGNTLPILIILVLLYYTLDKEFLPRVIYLLIFSAHLNYVAKIFFHNPRPFVYNAEEFQVTTNVLNQETVWGAEGFSFPSGHSQTQGAIWGYVLNKIKYMPLFITGMVLLISIPLSRSYLGVHWPSDILVGVLFGLILAWVYVRIEPIVVASLEEWSDTKKIMYGILFSTLLIILGFIAIVLGSIIPFNGSISLSDPTVWAETDLGTYPGLFAGIVVGQVLEQKHVNFSTRNTSKRSLIIRVLLGFVSVVGLYYAAKGIDNFVMEFQPQFLWITQISNFLSYFVIAFCLAYVIPWLFTKFE
ncbi:MAG: phosphatase PAP2 family protein [Candidatus Hodarchaeales archaeon]|jgi:membrane-associated phospholipid phosphatase